MPTLSHYTRTQKSKASRVQGSKSSVVEEQAFHCLSVLGWPALRTHIRKAQAAVAAPGQSEKVWEGPRYQPNPAI